MCKPRATKEEALTITLIRNSVEGKKGEINKEEEEEEERPGK